MRWLFVLLLSGAAAFAEGEPAGRFDYYVLSLSWSPGWCATEGEARNSPQCDRDLGWVLHGLWPQYRTGYPSYCPSTVRDPSRNETAAMEDIMGTDGAAWYQWKKHGRCAGLAARDYLALARRAYASVKRPPVFAKIDRDIQLPASVIEESFLENNPGLMPDMISVTCQANRIQEVRICLSKALQPMTCGADVIRDCTLKDALLDGR